MAKPDEQQLATLRREFEKTVRFWLDKRRLAGDGKGAIYYISYEHEGELYRALREAEKQISQR